MKPELLTAIAGIISACTALIAVLIGPIITERSSHRKTVSAMREKWINDLRETLSDLTSTAETAAAVLLQARAISPELKEKYDQLTRLETKAKMMLNPAKMTHLRLQQQLEEIVALAGEEKKQAEEKMSEMRALARAIVPTTQAVFKEAWEKMK